MDKTTLHVVIDLGSDTLKIAFAYKLGRGKSASHHMGKIDGASLMTQIGIPAIAFMKKDSGKWIFGDEVDRSGEQDFTTVVHIKSLMSLLARHPDKSVWESNKNYYFKNTIFPKFFLPSERKHFDDLSVAEKEGKAFDGKDTPQHICEMFFEYAKGLVEDGVKKLTKKTGMEFSDTTYSIIYPSKVGLEYIDELSRIIEATFGKKVYKSLSSVKSLGMFAYHNKMVKDDERCLVFDIGEEYISVAKVWFYNGQLFIDGVEGHKPPTELGGINIDEAIRSHIEDSIAKRETFATPSANDPSHVNEECLDSKKYQLLKDIKSAKHILSSEICGDEAFKNGVPMYISRDCLVQRYLTVDELEDSIGINHNTKTSAVEQICNYIVEEAVDKINVDVSKILIAGGVIETCGLDQYVKEAIRKRNSNLKVLTFDDEQGLEYGEPFKINANESSVYAAVLGGAVVAVDNIVIKTTLSLSYGTWVKPQVNMPNGESKNIKTFSFFVEKGQELNPDAPTRFMNQSYSHSITVTSNANAGVQIPKDETLCTVASKRDIATRKYSTVRGGPVYGTAANNNEPQLIIGDEKSVYRRAAEDYYKMKTAICSDIWFFHDGRRVKVTRTPEDINKGVNRSINFVQGIIVDPSGVATMEIETCNNSFDVMITYWDKRTRSWGTSPSSRKRIHASQLDMDYAEKHDIQVQSNQD